MVIKNDKIVQVPPSEIEPELCLCVYRVRTGPGKPGSPGILLCHLSWKKATGPGKSWKFVKLG